MAFLQTISPRLLLRLGVSFAFIYPAVSAWITPYAWVGYFPAWLLAAVPLPTEIVLHGFGALEIGIGLWILFGTRITLPCMLATVLLAAIVVSNLNQFDVLFRDISILLASAALLQMTSVDVSR